MPDPIQSSVGPNQSYYDPSEQVSRAPEASAPPPAPPPPAPVASAAPSGGTQALLSKYEGENCTKHLITAGLSFTVAGASATGAVLTSATGVGAVVGTISTAANIVKGAADLAAYFNCEDKNAALLRSR